MRNTEADLVVLPKEILMAMRRDQTINEVLRLLIHSDIFPISLPNYLAVV